MAIYKQVLATCSLRSPPLLTPHSDNLMIQACHYDNSSCEVMKIWNAKVLGSNSTRVTNVYVLLSYYRSVQNLSRHDSKLVQQKEQGLLSDWSTKVFDSYRYIRR
jgi:hypothetical protein